MSANAPTASSTSSGVNLPPVSGGRAGSTPKTISCERKSAISDGRSTFWSNDSGSSPSSARRSRRTAAIQPSSLRTWIGRSTVSRSRESARTRRGSRSCDARGRPRRCRSRPGGVRGSRRRSRYPGRLRMASPGRRAASGNAREDEIRRRTIGPESASVRRTTREPPSPPRRGRAAGSPQRKSRAMFALPRASPFVPASA